jgi:hypothetical protein
MKIYILLAKFYGFYEDVWKLSDEEAIELFKGDCSYCGKEH